MEKQSNQPENVPKKHKIGSVLSWDERGKLRLIDLMSQSPPPSQPKKEPPDVYFAKNIDGSTYRQTELFG